MTTSTDGLDELRHELAQLRREHDELRAQLSSSTTPNDAGEGPRAPSIALEAVPAQSSRRGMLKLAAGAAAGGAVAAIATAASPVAANDGGNLLIGTAGQVQGNTGRTRTSISYTNANGPLAGVFPFTFAANIFLARDAGAIGFSPDASSYPAAVGGYGYSAVANGVYGFSGKAGGYGTVGYGGVGATGVLARGARANLELYPAGTAPPNRADAHLRGEVIADSSGNVWLCTAAGSPGTWTKLAGPATAGAFHAIAPKRVYDSRPNTSPFLPPKAPLNPGQNRVIDCTLNASTVPPGARAVALNLTAAGPTGSGNLAVYPDGTPPPTTSTINYTPGVNIANSSVSGCGPGAKIRVQCGPTSASGVNFIVDIIGYYR